MLPQIHKNPEKTGSDSDEIAYLNPAPRPPIIQRRPAGSMRAAMDLCADALIQAMVSTRKF